MNWPDAKTLRAMAEVVMNDLYVIGPLVVTGCLGTWWLRSALSRATIEGLTAQNSALRDQNDTFKQRMELAQDSEHAATRKADEMEAQLTLLRHQLADGLTNDALGTSAEAASTLSEIRMANTAISHAVEDWPLRKLFTYLAPHLPLTAHKKTDSGGIVDSIDERWRPIGATVQKTLSLGRLHATGREIRGTKRLSAAPISPEFWRDAKWTYWFLDEGPSIVLDASNGLSYAEIEVNPSEALAIWPEDMPLFEAATFAHEQLQDRPISILAEQFARSPNDILVWYCDEMAKHRNGKDPLLKLKGAHLPARDSREIYMAPLNLLVFVVQDSEAIILQDQDGSDQYINLTVSRRELGEAINALSCREV